ncbi:hypothetical protein IKE71_03355 [Candidatus Saccharibacteria bacterium]|nr:hypothetical protein [Candidatus Saccharibacteria bacterium]
MEEPPKVNEDLSQIPPALDRSEKQGSKPKNGFKIATVILAFLTLASLGFGVYGFFFKKPSQAEAINSLNSDNLDAISVVSDVKDLPTTKISEPQEITITNPYILRDLNHKFTLLHGRYIESSKTESGQFLTATWVYDDTRELYETGDYAFLRDIAVSVSGASAYTLDSRYGNLISSLEDYLSSFKGKYDITAEVTYDSVSHAEFVPYEDANQLYHDLAGTDSNLPKEDYATSKCKIYHYVPTVDGFINITTFITGGCGGAGGGSILVRKDSFKAKGDEAYIDVHLISTSYVDWESEPGAPICRIYDGFTTAISGGSEERTEIDRITGDSWCDFPDDYASTHPSILDRGQPYRFIFKKNSEGIYSFVKVEKL